MLLTSSSRSFRDVIRDLRWGLNRAFPITALFGSLGAIFRLLIGPSYAPGVTLPELILAYAVMGIVAGALVGVFRPLTRGLIGSAALGAIWGICLDFVIFRPFGRWVLADGIFLAICCIGGALFGVQIRRVSTRIENKRRAGLLE